MIKYKTTIMQVAIHKEDSNPVFGEGNTYVGLADEAAGSFIVVEQHDFNPQKGIVQLEYNELLAVVDAAKMLLVQEGVAE